MSKFLNSTIGRKFLMGVSGLFLMLFILVHLTVNLLLIFDDSGELFNQAAHFMVTNPVIRVVEPILGLGFLIHIIWSLIITWQNWRARPIRYNKQDLSQSSSWASRNMLILGSLIFVFLVMHILNFYWKIRISGSPLLNPVVIGGVEIENTYNLVSSLFKDSILYSLLYILGGVLLGLHVMHGFWSSFQTLGINNQLWMKRLQFLAKIYAVVVATGFCIIPLYFIIKF